MSVMDRVAGFGRLVLVDPMVRKELYGASRRWGTYAGRSLYVLILGLIVWMRWWGDRRYGPMDYADYARLGHELFMFFSFTQLTLIAVASIVQSSDMISKEVRAGTLGILFLTPLRPWQIVLGKWKSCLGNLSALLFSGVPVLAISVYLGGVKGSDLLQVTSVTAVTCGFCVAFSLYVSSFFKGGAGGLVMAIIGLLAYGILPPLFMELLDVRHRPQWSFLALTDPYVTLNSIFQGTGTDWFEESTWLVACGVLGALAALLMIGTAARLKALAQADRRLPFFLRLFGGMDRAFDLPNVLGKKLLQGEGDVWEEHPYLWKELHTRLTGKLRYMTRICLALLILLVLGIVIFADDLSGSGTMIWPVVLMLFISIFMSIGAGASSFAREREDQKWDVLMTLPLDVTSFVLSKLAGAFVSLVPMGVLMALFLVLPLLLWETLIPFIPVYTATFFFSAFLVTTGMFLSIRSQTTRRAFALTLGLCAVLLLGIPFLLLMAEVVGFRAVSGREEVGTWLVQATDPFLYLESIDRYRYHSYYSAQRSFPVGALLAFCVLYGGASVGMLVNMIRNFPIIRYKR